MKSSQSQIWRGVSLQFVCALTLLSLSSCVCPRGNVSAFAGSEISTLTVSESLPHALAQTHRHNRG